MPRSWSRLSRAVTVLCAAWVGAVAGAAEPTLAPQVSQRAAGRPVLLLGEVHDNPAGHALRNELLRERIESGWRPAIAMEQFDRERQPELDRALATCADADCVIRAASPAAPGWEWAHYRPVIELALRYRLPIVAANLSRADAGRVVRAGYAGVLDAALIAAYRLDQPLPDDLAQAQQAEIQAGHCGKMPAQMLPGMARAQVARDVWMAQAVREHAGRGVVLLAGNGHVRRDLGVPRWLAGLPPGAVWSVGFVEQAMPGAFDEEVTVPAHERGDPCAQFR